MMAWNALLRNTSQALQPSVDAQTLIPKMRAGIPLLKCDPDTVLGMGGYGTKSVAMPAAVTSILRTYVYL